MQKESFLQEMVSVSLFISTKMIMAACEFYMYIMYNGIQFKSSMYVCMCVCVHVYACARK